MTVSSIPQGDSKSTPPLQQWLDWLSKGWVPLLAAIYGSGYVVISIYHASLGLNEINLLRPKTAAAGILYLVFFGTAIFVLEFLRPVLLHLVEGLREPRRMAVLILVGSSSVLNADFLAAMPLGVFIHFDAGEPRHQVPFLLVSRIGIVCLATVWATGYIKPPLLWIHHWIILLCCGLDVALGVVFILFRGQFGTPQLSLFLLSVQMVVAIGVFLQGYLSRTVNWLLTGFLLLIILLVYSTVVYPHVRVPYGGGEATNAGIYLGAASGSNPAKQLHARIIDETDNGFYVIEDGHTEVRFIPRSQVNAIEFDKPRRP
jgi:hypothetical protein